MATLNEGASQYLPRQLARCLSLFPLVRQRTSWGGVDVVSSEPELVKITVEIVTGRFVKNIWKEDELTIDIVWHQIRSTSSLSFGSDDDGSNETQVGVLELSSMTMIKPYKGRGVTVFGRKETLA